MRTPRRERSDHLTGTAQVVALDARRQFLDDARAGGLADGLDEAVGDQAWRR